MFPYGKTVTIISQTVDNFGDRTDGSSTVVDDCAVYQTPGVEQVGGQDTVVYDLTVILPPGTSVSSTDRVTIDGVTYEVASEPIAWRSPFTGTEPGVQITARKVTG